MVLDFDTFITALAAGTTTIVTWWGVGKAWAQTRANREQKKKDSLASLVSLTSQTYDQLIDTLERRVEQLSTDAKTAIHDAQQARDEAERARKDALKLELDAMRLKATVMELREHNKRLEEQKNLWKQRAITAGWTPDQEL